MSHTHQSKQNSMSEYKYWFQKNNYMGTFLNKRSKDIINKRPVSVEKDLLAAKALKIMNEKKITALCVHSKSKKNKTIGLLHIHNIIEANIQ